MRYVINDDDLENWYSILHKEYVTTGSDIIRYVLEEIENEFWQHIPNENMESFKKLLQKRVK
jgi:hypothetical protein